MKCPLLRPGLPLLTPRLPPQESEHKQAQLIQTSTGLALAGLSRPMFKGFGELGMHRLS